MLPAQVSYWTLVENKRHNVATETQAANELREVSRHNQVTEVQARENIALGWASLHETERHNVAVESESRRHNVATENLGWRTLDETIRHNITGEQQKNIQLATDRLNAATNQLNARTNQLNARVNQTNASTRIGELAVAQANANTNRLNAFTNQYSQTTQANAAWNNSVTNRNNYGLNSSYAYVDRSIRAAEVKAKQDANIINGFSSLVGGAAQLARSFRR